MLGLTQDRHMVHLMIHTKWYIFQKRKTFQWNSVLICEARASNILQAEEKKRYMDKLIHHLLRKKELCSNTKLKKYLGVWSFPQISVRLQLAQKCPIYLWRGTDNIKVSFNLDSPTGAVCANVDLTFWLGHMHIQRVDTLNMGTVFKVFQLNEWESCCIGNDPRLGR